MDKEFRVVKILDSRKIVINAGSNDGITEGAKFEIYRSGGEQVHDPVTGDLLGELDIVKDTVYAAHVFEKMCICTGIAQSVMGAAIESMATLFTYNTRPLNVSPNQMSGGFSKEQLQIQVGDAVRFVGYISLPEHEADVIDSSLIDAPEGVDHDDELLDS